MEIFSLYIATLQLDVKLIKNNTSVKNTFNLYKYLHYKLFYYVWWEKVFIINNTKVTRDLSSQSTFPNLDINARELHFKWQFEYSCPIIYNTCMYIKYLIVTLTGVKYIILKRIYMLYNFIIKSYRIYTKHSMRNQFVLLFLQHYVSCCKLVLKWTSFVC